MIIICILIGICVSLLIWGILVIHKKEKELRESMDHNYIITPNPEPESRVIDPIIVEAVKHYVRQKGIEHDFGEKITAHDEEWKSVFHTRSGYHIAARIGDTLPCQLFVVKEDKNEEVQSKE